MHISYEWLKTYIDTELSAEDLSEVLTSIGLEVGGIEEVESIPGGLKGLVIGEVLSCVKHENSDHLHITEVSIGTEVLQIVCGAPNVAVGHAVVVATIGTVLGQGDDVFTIKKGKIRGVESFGMLCSEREIGIGTDDSGIILLPLDKAKPGQTAAEYYGVRSDKVLEIDITPNRIDATSHYGVARDLAAYLTQHHKETRAVLPQVVDLPQTQCPVQICVQVGPNLVSRYQGLVIRGVEVQESPEWLRSRLESIGQKSINNIVDITNYVLHEYGQPLHAYDLDKIGSKLCIGLPQTGQTVRLLDHEERTLTANDLVISNAEGQVLCLAGVMGAEYGATTEKSKSIFLEVAGFNASSVRKTAKRFGLSTDSSFRFERGLDESRSSWALARATALVLELCPGAYIDGGVSDYYPSPQPDYQIRLCLPKLTALIGKEIPKDDLERILISLEIKVHRQDEELWLLTVPRYRIDVTRDVDIAEEVMRIYGYNNIELSPYVRANLSTRSDSDRSYKRRLVLSEQLVGAGFNEILCNSLTAESCYEDINPTIKKQLVQLLNPLSTELSLMRNTLLFGGLQSISRNLRRQAKRFYFFEWGNCYRHISSGENSLSEYQEQQCLGLWLGGYRVSSNWAHPDEMTSAFELKTHIEHLLQRLSVNVGTLRYTEQKNDFYEGNCIEITADGGRLFIGRMGQVSVHLCQKQEIDIPIYYAELEWETLNLLAERTKVQIKDLPKYPVVRRDLSLLLDASVRFVDIEMIAYKSEKKLLKKCELFDVYEGKNLPVGKKSYAVAFYLQDETQTMSEKQIELIMEKIRKNLEQHLGASLR